MSPGPQSGFRDHPPNRQCVGRPLYPGAALDFDNSTSMIISNPSNTIYYFDTGHPQTVKAFYGIPAGESSLSSHPMKASRWTEIDTPLREAGRGFRIEVSCKHAAGAGRTPTARIAHLTGVGHAFPHHRDGSRASGKANVNEAPSRLSPSSPGRMPIMRCALDFFYGSYCTCPEPSCPVMAQSQGL